MTSTPGSPGAPDLATLLSDLVGAPYEHFDCYALARTVLHRLGVEWPRDVAELVHRHGQRHVAAALRPDEPLQAGDVLEMIDAVTKGTHVGVAIDRERFIHSTRHTGVVIARVAPYARARLIQARWRPFRLLEVKP